MSGKRETIHNENHPEQKNDQSMMNTYNEEQKSIVPQKKETNSGLVITNGEGNKVEKGAISAPNSIVGGKGHTFNKVNNI